MTRNIINIFFIATLAITFNGCGAGESGQEQHQHEDEGHDHHEEASHSDEQTVTLTEEQVAAAGIKTGTFDSLNVSGSVKVNGALDLPPQNVAAISTPMAGFVKKANYLVGNFVEKGAVLAVMEHPDYLKIQEEYLALVSKIGFLEAEWERQQQLDSANITARKNFQKAKAEYKAASAKIKSLEKQLVYLGLSPENIKAGQLSSTIVIRAPFSGHITQLNTHNGMFVQPTQELYEMINPEHMHIELNVFEKDISKVAVGQEIRFTVPAMGEKEYQGEVFLVGKSFDREKKTVRVHGHIHNDPSGFVRGYYVNATIYTGHKKVRALPGEAIVRDEGKEYIFILKKEKTENHDHPHEEESEEKEHEHAEAITFQKVEVTTGTDKNGMTEIEKAGALPAGAEIVVKGAYDIFSEMKKGEGGHHHH